MWCYFFTAAVFYPQKEKPISAVVTIIMLNLILEFATYYIKLHYIISENQNRVIYARCVKKGKSYFENGPWNLTESRFWKFWTDLYTCLRPNLVESWT